VKQNIKTPKETKRDLEREIDEIAYQLYGLTEEEIVIIEQATQR
jgi:type II restriction/modification system DNA methylase subunit YeeA